LKIYELMYQTKYQNSICSPGFLHDLIPIAQVKEGSLERCTRCGLTKHFPFNVSNAEYLSYHIKSTLQPSDYLFLRHYPNFNN
jgi:hypothetical protein